MSQPHSLDAEKPLVHNNVGLDELNRTDRLLVQQVGRGLITPKSWLQLAEYSEAACCCGGYEGENQFEVTDR